MSNTKEKGDQDSDWENARNWLMHPDVTRMSAKVPSLSDISSEFELYEYLRDGSELCRLIGLLTQDRVLEGIVYRTQNIAALEEKNIALFLNTVEQKLELKGVFGGHGIKVFQKFANFFVALKGLARISAKIEKTRNIPKFYCSGKKTEQLYCVDGNYQSNEVQGYREAEYDQRKNIIKIEFSPTSLDFAIEELIDFNKRFLREVLSPLKRFEEKNTNVLLKREFFPVFQLEKLIQLHEKLRVEFEGLEFSYVKIGKVFEDAKDDFLVYSSIVAHMKLAMDFFADQMSENQDVIKEVSDLEKTEGIAIKDVSQLIPHFAMKWALVLEAVRERAYKERKQQVESEARKAHEIINDVFNQMDRVSADFQYKAAMDTFVDEIKGINDFSPFGVLVKEVNGVDFCLGSHGESENFKKVDLLITDEFLIVVNLKPKFAYKSSFLGAKKVLLPDKERSLERCFRIEEFDYLKNVEVPKTNLANLWVKTYKDMRADETRSFVLKLPRELAFVIEPELKRTEKIKEGSKHLGHTWKKYHGRGDLSECGLRCDECGKLMQGLYFCAIVCETCNKIFHKECFSAVISDPDLEDDGDDVIEDSLYYIIQKRRDLELEDFFVPEADQAKAQELLSRRKFGAFLMISAENTNWLIVVDQNSQLSSFEIKTVEVHGSTLYYIEKGTSAESIVGLLSKHRRSHRLVTPITLKDTIDDDETEKESSEEEDVFNHQIDNLSLEDPVEGYPDYLWDNITASEADQLLSDVAPGTFLLRKKGEEFRLSWKSYKLEVKHAVIKNVSGGFQMTQLTFRSLDLLVTHFQKYEKSSTLALGSPLLRETEEDNKDLQRSQPSARIPGFQGTMSSREAEAVLLAERQDTYIVRKNSKANLKVSFKNKNQVEHIKFETEEKGYSVRTSNNERVFSTSVDGMITKLRLKGLFNFPLQSTDLSHASKLHLNNLPPSFPEVRDPDPSAMIRPRTATAQRYQPFFEDLKKPLARTYSAPTRKSINIDDLLSDNEDLQESEPEAKGTSGEDQEEGVADIDDHTDFKFLHNISKNAAKGILFDKPQGTWMLYYNEDNQERIAWKAEDKVRHMKIISAPSGFTLRKDEEPVKLGMLIYKLQEQGTLKEQVSQQEESEDEEN